MYLPWWSLVVAAGAGVACLVHSWRTSRRRGLEQTPGDLRLAVGLPLCLAVVSSLGAALAPLSALPWMHLHLWARGSVTPVACLTAAAAALATWPRAKERLGSVALFALASGVVFVGSLGFRERMGGDCFGTMGPPLPVRDAVARRARDVDVGAPVSQLRLSPRGTRFAVATVPPGEDRYRSSGTTEFLVSGDDESLRSVHALAVDFIDEDRLAVLEQQEGQMVLKIVVLADPASGSGSSNVVHEMPLLTGPRLWTSVARGWRVVGEAWEGDELVVLQGELDSDESEERHYPLEGVIGSLVSVNREGWALGTSYAMWQPAEWNRASSLLYGLFLSARSTPVEELRLSRSSEAPRSVGATAFAPVCVPGPPAETRFFCAASDGERTGILVARPLVHELPTTRVFVRRLLWE